MTTIETYDNDSSGNYSELLSGIKSGNLNINERDKDGFTVLMYAVYNKREKLVKDLLKFNPKLDIKEKDGDCALTFAAWNGYDKIIKMMLDAGADVNIQGYEQKTPLHLTIEQKHFKTMMVLLKHKKIDINITDEYNQTPLDIAVKLDRPKAIKELNKFKNTKKIGRFAKLMRD